jgi:hypothetical protein
VDGTGQGSCPLSVFGISGVRSLCELPVVKHEEVQCCTRCTNSAVCGALTALYVVH